MIDNFREKQYELIPELCDLIVNYISRQNQNYLQMTSKSFVDESSYMGLYNCQFTKLTIEVMHPDDNTPFQMVSLHIPKLIDGYMYFLNGNYYIPTIYASDYPIVLKKESIKIFGLFNSITILNKSQIAIFMGNNIPLSYFFEILFANDPDGLELYAEYIEKFNLEKKQHKIENIVKFFKNKFKSGDTPQDVVDTLNSLFMDDYTRDLYSACYQIENPTLSKIVKLTMEMAFDDPPNFIDLSYKRLTFIESLFRPLFERTVKLASDANRGFRNVDFSLNQLAILKYFLTSSDNKSDVTTKKQLGLSGNYIYNTDNLYSGILKNKISMVPPGIKRAPQQIQEVHDSHIGKICPISISSQKPGHVVSIVPGVKLDKFGRFT